MFSFSSVNVCVKRLQILTMKLQNHWTLTKQIQELISILALFDCIYELVKQHPVAPFCTRHVTLLSLFTIARISVAMGTHSVNVFTGINSYKMSCRPTGSGL
jgi:hypothetical protein